MKKLNTINNIKMKKCNERRHSVSLFNTSSTGAVTSLIVIATFATLCSFFNLFSLINDTFATASTLTISVADSIGLNIVPSGENGTFMTSSTSTNNVSVSTTHGTGYTLGIKASAASSNALINSNDSNKTIPSITSSTSESNYANDTYASTNNLNNTWGYRPSKYNSSANSNYLQAPTSTSTTTIDATTAANSTANNYNIAIGTRITNTTTSGTYNNTFVFTVTANPSIYSITYNANGGSGAPANVSNQTTNGSSVTLSSTTPTRTGYDFAGWCTSAPSDNASSCPSGSTAYSAGSNWTIDQTAASNSLTLYARWTLKSYTVTVNFAGSGVSSATFTNTTYGGGGTVSSSGGTVSLKHGVSYTLASSYSSGNEFSSYATATNGTLGSTSSASTTYAVTGASTLTVTGKSAKLWFQNATSANCGSTMYDNRGTDTYKNVAYTTAKIGSLCWMTRNLDLPGGTALTNSDTNLNGSVTSYTLPASSTSGFSSNSTAYVYNSGRTTCSSNSSTGSCYSYYSYKAATAGTSPSSGAASSDICPYGWRLPTKAEYDTLKGTYTTGATLTASPWLGVYAGRYVNSSFNDGGSYGRYWSSTAYNSSNAYFLYFGSSSAYTSIYDYKYNGFSIRCVAKS